MANKALINYYARLLQKGYDRNNIPEDLRDAVDLKFLELPPLEEDPETETPEKK